MFVYIIVCNGIQGSRFYTTEKDAAIAAAGRSRFDGRAWKTRKIYLPKA